MNGAFFFSKHSQVIKFVLFLLLISALLYFGRIVKFDIERYRQILSQYPIYLSGFIYVVLYVVTTTFIWFGPKDVLRVSGAILFGGTTSAVLVWIGEMMNAVIFFQTSRVLGRDFVVQKFKLKSKDVDPIQGDVRTISVVALRLNPLIPFRFIDLGFGLSSISLKKYWTIIFFVSPLRIFWLQTILASVGEGMIKDFSYVYQYLSEHPFIIFYSMLYFLAIVIVTLAAVVVKVKGNAAKTAAS